VVADPAAGSAVLEYCPPFKRVLIQLLDDQLNEAAALYATAAGGFKVTEQAAATETVTEADAGLFPAMSVPVKV